MTGAHAIAHGDVLAILKELPDNEFDALLCDPPYGFSFMGKSWDYDVPGVDVWREALRVLKPGAPLIAFGGTRTFHRIAVGIEDAGFELRDVLSWMYGSGFPKSLDVSKALDKAAGAERRILGRAKGAGAKDLKSFGNGHESEYDLTAPATPAAQQWAGYGTALKPAWEPAILARKPIEGTVAANVAKWGVGGLAIDACRIGTDDKLGGGRETGPTQVGEGWDRPWMHDESMRDEHARRTAEKIAKAQALGRWPANVAMDEDAAAVLDASVSSTTSVPYTANTATGAVLPMSTRTAGGYTDSGGPSRFFYCAKVSTREREHGCESLPMRSNAEMTDSAEGAARLESPRTGAGRGGGARNHHPTLKPIALAKWLARLIMPPTPNATLLVPYSGAGSEMIGALTAGWPMVFGIEGDADYIEIAHARIAAWSK